jgi:tRNA A-37 threonylcarbamoyl transferase component Bud32/tetratricopeptide (TPR) repeat protein
MAGEQSEVPEQVGKYRIVAKIGQGAMGEVYRAEDPVLKRPVAIKMISSSAVSTEALDKRFQREAQSVARLNHPNIVTIYDFGEEGGRPYMAMELLEGIDLREAILKKLLSPGDRLRVMVEICAGLAYAHERGVVHRDLKPANIHLTRTGQVKIMDFGLARIADSDMTQAGLVMGTPNYMAPEQVRGERADTRSDVFALGAVMYELLSARKPFDAPSVHTILMQVLQEEPQPLHSLSPELPPAVVSVVEKALAKDPGARFRDAGEMLEGVRAAREALTTSATMLMPGPGAESASSPALRSSRGSWPPTRGSEAVKPAPRTQASLAHGSVAPTLHAEAPTELGLEAHPAARSRAGLYLGIGAVALLGAATAGYLVQRQRSATVAPTGNLASEQEGILREALVDSQLELARLDLQNKDYRGAIEQVDRALAVDPANAEAGRLKEQAQSVLTELESTAGQARQAFAAGDPEGASRALSRVLALDPRHPVVAELTAALNQHFRGQAEAARQAAEAARQAAAPFRPQAAAELGAADRAAQEAQRLGQNEQFTAATQKYFEARDGYDKARRTAEAAAAAAARAAAVARAAAATQPTAPPASEARASQATLPPPSATVSVPPAPPGTQPLATRPPSVVPALPTRAADEAAVRQVLEDYGRAIEGKDLTAFRRVKPNLTREEESRLQQAFKAIKSQQVGIRVEAVEFDATGALVRVVRKDVVNGREMKEVHQTFRLARAADAWKIEQIGQN